MFLTTGKEKVEKKPVVSSTWGHLELIFLLNTEKKGSQSKCPSDFRFLRVQVEDQGMVVQITGALLLWFG